MASETGTQELRGENIDRAVKVLANKLFKMKQVLSIQSSNKWKETYFQETQTILTASGDTNANLKGVPRGATFPHVDPTWSEKTGRHLKHAAEGTVFNEDKITGQIDVMRRTLFKVSQAIAESVDQHIYSELTGASGIGTAAAANDGWDAAEESTRKPISDLLKGKQNMLENQYDWSNVFLLLTPHDERALMENSKVINNPSFKTADIVSNGVMGQIVGAKMIVSTTVDDDEAMLIIGQRAATYKTAQGLKTDTIEDKQIKFTIRSSEIGQVQVTDPLGIYVITDTQEL